MMLQINLFLSKGCADDFYISRATHGLFLGFIWPCKNLWVYAHALTQEVTGAGLWFSTLYTLTQCWLFYYWSNGWVPTLRRVGRISSNWGLVLSLQHTILARYETLLETGVIRSRTTEAFRLHVGWWIFSCSTVTHKICIKLYIQFPTQVST